MIRGSYNSQVQPPAPFVVVTLRDPLGGDEGLQGPAQLDTAADRTVVPLAWVRSLGLEPIDEVKVGGFGGHEQKVLVYVISLAVQTFPPSLLRVYTHPDEPWVLLGRDVLNAFRLVLDGPARVLELG